MFQTFFLENPASGPTNPGKVTKMNHWCGCRGGGPAFSVNPALNTKFGPHAAQASGAGVYLRRQFWTHSLTLPAPTNQLGRGRPFLRPTPTPTPTSTPTPTPWRAPNLPRLGQTRTRAWRLTWLPLTDYSRSGFGARRALESRRLSPTF